MKKTAYIAPSCEQFQMELHPLLDGLSTYGDKGDSEDQVGQGSGNGESDDKGVIWPDSKENLFLDTNDDWEW